MSVENTTPLEPMDWSKVDIAGRLGVVNSTLLELVDRLHALNKEKRWRSCLN